MEAEIQRARAVNSIKAREKYEHSLDTFWQIFKQMSAEIQNGAEAMNTRTHPDEATPLTDDLEGPWIHDPETPLKLREYNEADAIMACGLSWGCGFTEAHKRLRNMNFTDFEFMPGASNGN